MATKTLGREVPLTLAAMELRRSYHQTLRLVLVGELEARKEGRAWMVSRRSLDRLLGEREDAHAPAA